MKNFKQELEPIYQLLCSQDEESAYLGYNLLRDTEFKKMLRNKVWSENNKSFYRFRLFVLRSLKDCDQRTLYHRRFSNYNKVCFAHKVVMLYLEGKLIIKTIK